MSSQDQALPAIAPARTLDQAVAWFWQFLKTELAPYPGRAWVVGRMTIAATIIMVLVMTFRIPYGFQGAIYTFFLSRESLRATLTSGIRIVIVSAIASAYTLVTIAMLVADPLTHFLWIALALFLVFFVIRIVPDYGLALAFGFTLAVAIPIWDQATVTVNDRVENTLWVCFTVIMGSAVTVAVEYVFRRVHPITELEHAIDSRLRVVEELLRQIAAEQPVGGKLEKDLALYSGLGISRMRRQLLRSDYPQEFVARMNVAVALLGRLTDLASSMRALRFPQSVTVQPSDRERCARLAERVAELRQSLAQQKFPVVIDIPSQSQPSGLPLLPEMETTVALIPHAFSGSRSLDDLFRPPPLIAQAQTRLLVPDAFSNPEHLKFAIRGGLAALLAYVIYQSVNWTGISTAMITCVATALTTIGSSRQKQFLRLGGVLVGGVVFGFGAQVFVLPYVNSIVGFTVVFAIVTAISAWIGTATPRLSYLGVQVALAWYLINLQEFTIQSSLAVARDRVVGTLLGLTCMWLVFDRLWVKDALQEMQEAFCGNLRLLAELMEPRRRGDVVEVAKRVVQLRDQINDRFNTVRAQSDAVLFEFGPARQRKLAMRDDFRRWQSPISILAQVQITFLQYFFEERFPELPQPIADAEAAFERDMAGVARAMADETGGLAPSAVPDIQQSAQRLQQEIKKYYEASGVPVPPPLLDMMTLTQNLASVAAPLHDDIHYTFSTPHLAAVHRPELKLKEA
ncbi:MAG TPA: FUSC family protein [Terriglobales bacterium]|nr:FUSC family protein [Terriglobales bacterium]